MCDVFSVLPHHTDCSVMAGPSVFSPLFLQHLAYSEHMVEPIAEWIKCPWVQLFLQEFVHRFVHSDIHAYIQQALLSTLCQSIAGDPSVLWQIAQKFLRIYYLSSKTKTITLFGHHYYTCNWNIGLIKPKPVPGNLSLIEHLLCAWHCIRYRKENNQ